MEIILTSEDIKELIQNTYEGVEHVTFSSEDVKATLKLSGLSFMKVKQPQPVAPTQPEPKPKPVDPETLQKVEAQKGVMASGGERRNLMKF